MFRQIQIRAVLNGFIVKAGCQTLVFETKAQLLGAIAEYLGNPQATEEKFLKESLFGMQKEEGPSMMGADAPYASALQAACNAGQVGHGSSPHTPYNYNR